MRGGINSSKMMNLALTSKGQLRNHLPVESLRAYTSSGSVPVDTTQLLVLLGGTKLGVELVLRGSGVKLRIRRQIAFLGGGGVIQDEFNKELYFGHAKKYRDRLEPDRTIQIHSTPAF